MGLPCWLCCDRESSGVFEGVTRSNAPSLISQQQDRFSVTRCSSSLQLTFDGDVRIHRCASVSTRHHRILLRYLLNSVNAHFAFVSARDKPKCNVSGNEIGHCDQLKNVSGTAVETLPKLHQFPQLDKSL